MSTLEKINTENAAELLAIKEKSNAFAEQIKIDIYALCEKLDYKNSSIFSYNIDRIEAFIRELNDFNITQKP